ncbi:RNA polymerase II-associated protein 3-like [Lytechinus variegatus]|uniref:RNA polymerase II-associated protein 3-like n=1 Tax=Lytechinus variegatus TaxID=7654 RepID=UPI001BB283A3|nr:RNA polymerase II-associated protein 3-like [Lytechinus variegatus]
MSADKFLQLQKDVRHNQEDIQSFLRDLDSWETNIKKRDNELKQGTGGDAPASSKEKVIPPIRNRKVDTKKKRKKKQDIGNPTDSISKEATSAQTNGSSSTEGKKIRCYDYRTWDKFDVDAACAALDSDDEESARKAQEEDDEEEETDSEAEREEMETQRKIMEANAEKEKGNVFFKKGKYEEALACYSKGLNVDPDNALLSANRAMALLKLKRYEEAEKDCDLAISLDCTYVKAYARRGAARLELSKLEEAKKDFQQVLNIETENKQAKNEIKKIDKLLKEREEERRRAEEPSNVVHAVEKPPHLRSKRPLKRMTIQEVGKGVAEEKQREREKMKMEREKLKVKQGKGDSVPSDQRKQNGDLDRTDDKTIQEIKSRTDGSSDGKAMESNCPKSSGSKQGKGDSPRGGGGVSPRVASNKPTVPGVPSTSYQLQADWKRLQSHTDVLFEYFKKIPPASYPKLFQNSLETAMLNQILHLLTVSYIPSNTPIFETLERLTAVKRFDMNVMFMSQREKQVIQGLFSHLKSEVDEQKHWQLAKKYGL